jgi:hypothetical protein
MFCKFFTNSNYSPKCHWNVGLCNGDADVTKLIVAFRNFVTTPENRTFQAIEICLHIMFCIIAWYCYSYCLKPFSGFFKEYNGCVGGSDVFRLLWHPEIYVNLDTVKASSLYICVFQSFILSANHNYQHIITCHFISLYEWPRHIFCCMNGGILEIMTGNNRFH